MNIELQKLELKNDIQSKVRFRFSNKREYFLHQQMKTIQEELGGVKRKKWTKCYKVFDQNGMIKLKHFDKELSKNASHESCRLLILVFKEIT
jgi:ATP-dependent Lon protease